MELLLLRHAEAEPDNISDRARRLTEKGIRQGGVMGRFCLENDLLPEVILTSPYVRSRETARLFAQSAGLGNPIESAWLGCGMTPETCCEQIAEYRQLHRILLVGHEPDFSSLVSHLIGTSIESALRIRKASLTCIHLHTFHRGGGEILFSIPFRLVKTQP